MTEEKYLKKLTKYIHDPEIRKEIQDEYRAHIHDCKQALICGGMTENEAEAEAVRQMGDPVLAGRKMDQIYRSNIDWKMAVWFVCCALLIGGLKVSVVIYYQKDLDNETYNLIMMVTGIAFLVWGLFWSAVEKCNNYELFYVWAEDWGGAGTGLVNSGVQLAMGVAFLSTDFQTLFVLILIVEMVQMLERFLIVRAQSKKEEKLMWEHGVARTDILPYKGLAVIEGKKNACPHYFG